MKNKNTMPASAVYTDRVEYFYLSSLHSTYY